MPKIKMKSKTICNTKQNTKNECFVMRVEGDWKKKIKTISQKLDIPMSVFIRNSVNKNIRNF
jgi:hypothetical protein